eukprot:XP_027322180.1 fibulin-7-like [Anas platyrhynchos]
MWLQEFGVAWGGEGTSVFSWWLRGSGAGPDCWHLVLAACVAAASPAAMLLVLLPAWVALCVLQLPLGSTQECLSHQQVLSTVRQMQKLLSAQEAAHLQGTRSLKKQLSALQSRVQRLASKRNETCPQLAVPANGRKLGRSARVGHDVHFVCDAGFRLVGSETRTCRRDRTWGGTQPFCRSIDDCASNPCANGGTCVDGNQSYTCLCPRGWSGTSCQSPVYTYWVTLSNSSFSRQPRCAEGRPGSRHCSCDTGFQMRAGGVCQDVDECQLFQPSPQTRLCLHDCLNLPGSYRCLCPPGYVLHADRNTCEGKTQGNKHPVLTMARSILHSQEVWGRPRSPPFCHHRCRRVHREPAQLHPRGALHQHLRGPPLRAPQVPPAPPQHQLCQDIQLDMKLEVTISLFASRQLQSAANHGAESWYLLSPGSQCERNPCPMDSRACRLAATSISFHYLPLQANRSVPRVLFKMSTTRFVGDSLRFAIMGGRGQGVFAVRRSDRQTGELVLTSPVVGPATLEVELEMSEFSRKVLLGKHIFKVTAFVSPYEF